MECSINQNTILTPEADTAPQAKDMAVNQCSPPEVVLQDNSPLTKPQIEEVGTEKVETEECIVIEEGLDAPRVTYGPENLAGKLRTKFHLLVSKGVPVEAALRMVRSKKRPPPSPQDTSLPSAKKPKEEVKEKPVGKKASLETKKVTPPTPEIIKLGVVHSDSPANSISKANLVKLKKGILSEILSSKVTGFALAFGDCVVKAGWLQVTCQNKETANWLKNLGGRGVLGGVGKIKIVEEINFPYFHIAVAYLPHSTEVNTEDMMKFFIAQNSDLPAAEWKVVSRRNEGTAAVLALMVDNATAQRLKRDKFVNYQFTRIPLRLKETKGSPSSYGREPGRGMPFKGKRHESPFKKDIPRFATTKAGPSRSMEPSVNISSKGKGEEKANKSVAARSAPLRTDLGQTPSENMRFEDRRFSRTRSTSREKKMKHDRHRTDFPCGSEPGGSTQYKEKGYERIAKEKAAKVDPRRMDFYSGSKSSRSMQNKDRGHKGTREENMTKDGLNRSLGSSLYNDIEYESAMSSSKERTTRKYDLHRTGGICHEGKGYETTRMEETRYAPQRAEFSCGSELGRSPFSKNIGHERPFEEEMARCVPVGTNHCYGSEQDMSMALKGIGHEEFSRHAPIRTDPSYSMEPSRSMHFKDKGPEKVINDGSWSDRLRTDHSYGTELGRRISLKGEGHERGIEEEISRGAMVRLEYLYGMEPGGSKELSPSSAQPLRLIRDVGPGDLVRDPEDRHIPREGRFNIREEEYELRRDRHSPRSEQDNLQTNWPVESGGREEAVWRSRSPLSPPRPTGLSKEPYAESNRRLNQVDQQPFLSSYRKSSHMDNQLDY